MEAILRSVLLRQERMEMQWDAEFEQQRQLFHINTSTLIDMLPIHPRKKRVKLEGSVPVPSHDKENMVGFLGFVPNGIPLKSPKTKAPHSRRLAKRDLNTRFCDNDVKDGGRTVATKPAEAQPSLRNCSDAERMQQNASTGHAVKSTKQGCIGVPVKGEVDDGDVHVPPPIDDSSPRENRKRLRGEQEGDIVFQNRNEQNVGLSNDGEEFRVQINRTSLVDLPEKKTRPKRARKVGKSKECALEVEAQELSCRDKHLPRGDEADIARKVEVETEVETCKDIQVMRTVIVEPEIVSKGPSRRGRSKVAITVSPAAAVPDIVRNEPIRRGRAKQAFEPQISQRVTRSRARMVNTVVASKLERSSVVETLVASFPEICEEIQSAQGVFQESTEQDIEREPLCEARVQDRSLNLIVEGQMEECSKLDVRAPPKEIVLDEPRSSTSSLSKGRKSVTNAPAKDSEHVFVANGLVRQGSPRFDSQDDPSSLSRSGERNAGVDSRVAEIFANVKNIIGPLKDGQHECLPQPQPQLDTIEKNLQRGDDAFIPAEHPACMSKEAGRGGIAPSAVLITAIAEEEAAKDARYLAASEGDALVEKSNLISRGSPFQLEATEEEMQAHIGEAPRPPAAHVSAFEEGNQRLGKNATVIPNVAGISESSRTVLSDIKETYTTLLSELIEKAILPLNKSGDSESPILARSHRSSLRSGRLSPIAVSLALSGSGSGASAREACALPTSGVTRKSTVAEVFVAGRDGLGQNLVGVLNTLTSERHWSDSGKTKGDDSIKADEEKSGQMTRDLMQDSVMNTTPQVSQVKEPISEARRMDMNQVKSDAVSPVRYSEERAVEEAIRCSLELEFHPDVTLTLNRWQFRKRLSPRSKARARRWRSDVATNGMDYGRGQLSDAPAASPSRIVSSIDRSLEVVTHETSLEAQSPDFLVEGIEPSFNLDAGKAVDQENNTAQQGRSSQSERSARRSISSLCKEILSQDVEIGDKSMETADERNGTSGPLPLLQSIYTLSKACQNDLAGAREFLEEGDRQEVHNLIESAKKFMEQLSNKAVGAHPRTPASIDPALNNSAFHAHTNLYPDRLRLFITPRPSPTAPQILLPSSSTFLSSVAPEVTGVIESTSLQMKRLMRDTSEQAGSGSSHLNSVLSEPAVRVDEAASQTPSRTPNSDKLKTISDSGNICILGEGDNALKSCSAVEPGFECSTLVDPIQVNLASDVLPNEMVPGISTVGTALLSSASTHSDGPMGLETVAETEKLSELRSRFYALSKDYIGTPPALKDVPNLLGDRPESLTSHFTNPPYLRFSPGLPSKELKGPQLGLKRTPPSPEDGNFDSGENEKPAVVLEGGMSIPCSPIFIGNERERVDHQRGDNSDPTEEPVERSQRISDAGTASMQRVEPQCSSNLMNDVPSVPPLVSNHPRSNLVSSLRSFIPLVQQQQPSAYPNGKRDVKVKALEAAEAARRMAEQKEVERQERKKAAELAKREKQERTALEKLAKREKAAQEKLRQQETRAERENEEARKRKAVGTGSAKSAMADSTSGQGTNNQNVLLKVKKTHELKFKMDQEKQERLLEEQRKKEEEWKKKEAETAARKRKYEAAEKKEREDKRRRQEDVMKAHRELEERQRLELEKKTQKQRAMEELEKERKAIEEELKRQRRLDKEREVEQRRRKEEEREFAWLEEKEATRKLKEDVAKQMKFLDNGGRQQAVKMRRPSNDPAMPSTGPYHSFMASLHVAMGTGEGIGAHLSGVNSVVESQIVSSQSLVAHPLRVLKHSTEGAGAIRNSQTALRVPRTTPESVPGVSNVILGSGKPSFRTPPEALGYAASTSVAVSSGGGSSAKALRDRINILQIQSGSKNGASTAGGSKPCQPAQASFAGPPGGVIGQGDKGMLSYEISPFRDSEDDDSEEEEKRSQKPIPSWARKENMLPQLVRQLEQDPDDIFVGASSCSLDEVFKVRGSKKRPDFKRRGSSGDWAKDCLTWQEQIQYKVTMGFLH